MRALVFIALAACGENQTPEPIEPPVLPSCVPDRDGTITAAELPVALGATIAYYASANIAIDQSGTAWNLSEERASDTVVGLGPVALATQWYATMFPGAAFVVDAGGGLDGVFHQDDQALWLHGIASHEPMPAGGKTLVRYAEPVPALRFPITDGDTFTAVADILDGTIVGLPFVGTDTYAVEVAGSGRLDVPYVTFSPALRVRTQLARTPSSGPAIGKRTTSFLFECFGEVVHAASQPNEANPDFTSAESLRRFALGEQP